MTTIAEAAAAIRTALGAVEGLRATTELGKAVEPPAAIVGPPDLEWRGYCASGDPTTARFVVYLVTHMDEYAVERLWEMIPVIALALGSVPDASVSTASPGIYPSGNVELPAYQFIVEVSL